MTSRRVGGDYTIQLIARIAVILLDGLTKPALRDMASRCLLKTTGTKGDLKRRLNSYMARRRTFREPYVGTRSQSKEPRKMTPQPKGKRKKLSNRNPNPNLNPNLKLSRESAPQMTVMGTKSSKMTRMVWQSLEKEKKETAIQSHCQGGEW